MGLFDEQVKFIRDFISEKERLGLAREFKVQSFSDWPLDSGLVLEEDAAVELGNPGLGSISFILWSQGEGGGEDRVVLVGPDINEIKERSTPFCQAVIVRGSFGEAEEYESYCALRDAVYDTRLEGMMTRVVPSRQTLWCRVNRESVEKGFSLAHLGAALIRNLREIEFVSGAEVVFVTSGKEDIEKLKKPGYAVGRIVGAMTKMVEEMNYDCDSCDFKDVCEAVEELKRLRKRLKEDRLNA